MSEMAPPTEAPSTPVVAEAKDAAPAVAEKKEPSPIASPGEVFAREDVPAGTLMSPEGLRKEGDEVSHATPRLSTLAAC